MLGCLPDAIYQSPHWEVDLIKGTDRESFTEAKEAQRKEVTLAMLVSICFMEHRRKGELQERQIPKHSQGTFDLTAECSASNK